MKSVAAVWIYHDFDKNIINLLPSSIKRSKHMCLSALQIWKRLFSLPYVFHIWWHLWVVRIVSLTHSDGSFELFR